MPFVFAAVELEEQPGLYVMANIRDCPPGDVSIDMPVRVAFEHIEDVWIPVFIPEK